MQNLLHYAEESRKKRTALGHFNVSTLDMVHAVVRGAEAVGVPAIIGVSEGERDFMGPSEMRALVSSLSARVQVPIFLNADHTYSFERAKEAINLGYDSIVIDGAKLSFAENVALARQVTDYANSVKSPIVVEGELGYIGQSSKLLDAVPQGAAVTDDAMTTVAQAELFVKETGVHMFSPAVGSIHGMLRSGSDPDLNIERIEAISRAVAAPLVLHGGSGLTRENFEAAVRAGISVVHVSTELRVAWRKALVLSLQEDSEEVAPYKILKPVVGAVQKVVEEKLRLFNFL